MMQSITIIKEVLLVGAGSFLGGACRYLVSQAMRSCSALFPWGTFAVNIGGSLLIGLLLGYFNRQSGDTAAMALFMTAGVCGGFTTFSTFSKEALQLLQSGAYTALFLYAVGSVILGIAAVALGYAMAK